ncbi:hypothetical protein VTL71DRAFT_12046 [Oculimacula yallundae]|uniref:Uncharacterized protein n=1 Tax=Oculimacula yallundae TaxID=86028 RepID=A0ABR4CSG0_9HELO
MNSNTTTKPSSKTKSKHTWRRRISFRSRSKASSTPTSTHTSRYSSTISNTQYSLNSTSASSLSGTTQDKQGEDPSIPLIQITSASTLASSSSKTSHNNKIPLKEEPEPSIQDSYKRQSVTGFLTIPIPDSAQRIPNKPSLPSTKNKPARKYDNGERIGMDFSILRELRESVQRFREEHEKREDVERKEGRDGKGSKLDFDALRELRESVQKAKEEEAEDQKTSFRLTPRRRIIGVRRDPDSGAETDKGFLAAGEVQGSSSIEDLLASRILSNVSHRKTESDPSGLHSNVGERFAMDFSALKAMMGEAGGRPESGSGSDSGRYLRPRIQIGVRPSLDESDGVIKKDELKPNLKDSHDDVSISSKTKTKPCSGNEMQITRTIAGNSKIPWSFGNQTGKRSKRTSRQPGVSESILRRRLRPLFTKLDFLLPGGQVVLISHNGEPVSTEKADKIQAEKSPRQKKGAEERLVINKNDLPFDTNLRDCRKSVEIGISLDNMEVSSQSAEIVESDSLPDDGEVRWAARSENVEMNDWWAAKRNLNGKERESSFMNADTKIRLSNHFEHAGNKAVVEIKEEYYMSSSKQSLPLLSHLVGPLSLSPFKKEEEEKNTSDGKFDLDVYIDISNLQYPSPKTQFEILTSYCTSIRKNFSENEVTSDQRTAVEEFLVGILDVTILEDGQEFGLEGMTSGSILALKEGIEEASGKGHKKRDSGVELDGDVEPTITTTKKKFKRSSLELLVRDALSVSDSHSPLAASLSSEILLPHHPKKSHPIFPPLLENQPSRLPEVAKTQTNIPTPIETQVQNTISIPTPSSRAWRYLTQRFIIAKESLSEELLNKTWKILISETKNSDTQPPPRQKGIVGTKFLETEQQPDLPLDFDFLTSLQDFQFRIHHAENGGGEIDPIALAAELSYKLLTLSNSPRLSTSILSSTPSQVSSLEAKYESQMVILAKLFINAILLRYLGIVIPFHPVSKFDEILKSAITRNHDPQDERNVEGQNKPWAEIAILILSQCVLVVEEIHDILIANPAHESQTEDKEEDDVVSLILKDIFYSTDLDSDVDPPKSPTKHPKEDADTEPEYWETLLISTYATSDPDQDTNPGGIIAFESLYQKSQSPEPKPKINSVVGDSEPEYWELALIALYFRFPPPNFHDHLSHFTSLTQTCWWPIPAYEPHISPNSYPNPPPKRRHPHHVIAHLLSMPSWLVSSSSSSTSASEPLRLSSFSTDLATDLSTAYPHRYSMKGRLLSLQSKHEGKSKSKSKGEEEVKKAEKQAEKQTKKETNKQAEAGPGSDEDENRPIPAAPANQQTGFEERARWLFR